MKDSWGELEEAFWPNKEMQISQAEAGWSIIIFTSLALKHTPTISGFSNSYEAGCIKLLNKGFVEPKNCPPSYWIRYEFRKLFIYVFMHSFTENVMEQHEWLGKMGLGYQDSKQKCNYIKEKRKGQTLSLWKYYSLANWPNVNCIWWLPSEQGHFWLKIFDCIISP